MATRLAVNKIGNLAIGAVQVTSFTLGSANFGSNVSCERTTLPFQPNSAHVKADFITNLYFQLLLFHS